MTNYRAVLSDALILFALVCGAFWKLTLSDQYTWANQSDMSDQVLPWLQFQAHEWQLGRPWPLWDPHHWGGQSLIGQVQPAVMYPLNWLLFLWPLGERGFLSLQTLGWYLVLSRYMGAMFFYWLVRDCGRSRLAAVLGGVLFACTGYVGTTEWPQVVNGAVWGPLVLLFGLRMLKGSRTAAAWMGAALGMSVLAGHYQVPMHLLLLAGGLVLAAVWRRQSWRMLLAGALLAGGFAFLIGAAQLLPAHEYWRGALRWVGSPSDPLTWTEKIPFAVHQVDSLDPVSVVGIVVPRIYSALSNPYAGFVAAVLALFAVVSGWRSARIRLIAGLLLLFLLISLGAATWMYGVAYAVLPGFEKSRHPATAVAVWHMCLVLLACFGLDRLRRVSVAWLARTAGWLALFALFVYGSMVYLSLADPAKVFGRNEQSMAALSALALGCVLFAFCRGAVSAAFARMACVGIALVEVSNVAGYTYSQRAQGWPHLQYFEDSDIADFLRADPSFVRVNFDRAEVPYNFGDWWGLDQYQGYTGVPERLFRRAFEPEVRRLLGESHWISKSANWNGQTPVFESRRKLFVYRIAGASRQTWVESDCQGAENRVLERHAGFWQVEVSLDKACRGSLVINEAWSSGWHATVNGKPVMVNRYQELLKSIPLESAATPIADSGSRLNVVELRYQPDSTRWGVGLSITGLFALVGLGVLRKARPGRPKGLRG